MERAEARLIELLESRDVREWKCDIMAILTEIEAHLTKLESRKAFVSGHGIRRRPSHR